MCVVLIPIIKDKKAKISIIDNRPVAIASVVSKVVERVLLDRLSELDTMGNQFGFKPKLGTAICIYSLKEIIGSYNQLNGCVFSCFLDASKAFGIRIRQCVLDGVVQSHRNLECLMGSGKGEFCHRFCLIYNIFIWTICLLI